MKFLYIFPHPDDESFGPGPGLAAQVSAGHEVHLLSLTKGGATKERHRLKLSVEQMGEIREKEMHEVQKVLNLNSLTVLDLPDSGLKEIDPREVEKVAREQIEILKPDIVVTYPVHGISGFHDHLITHAAVKRVYLELQGAGAVYLKRLAFFALQPPAEEAGEEKYTLWYSSQKEIDCLYEVSAEDIQKGQDSLSCYVTYLPVIERTGIREKICSPIAYEIFGEDHDPPLGCLTEGL